MTASNEIDQARGVLRALIEGDEAYLNQRLTRERIAELAGRALIAAAVEAAPELMDRHVIELTAWAETLFTTVQDEAGVLVGDDAVHEPWVDGHQHELFPEGGFWRNYRRLVEPRLPPTALAELDRSTDRIVDLLGDPSREGIWDRRGLVIGHVQSGKTNSYLGVVTKAADAGYRLIVILAGSHNNLRAQTQHRFDEAFVGVDTRVELGTTAPAFGVGLNRNRRPAFSMTQATENGDFKKAVADSIGNPFARHDLPTVFVVKKHVTVLKTLHDWLRLNSGIPPHEQTIEDVPLLLIDDEADNASIDTANHERDPDTDPTGTNKRIREILQLFDQSAYVGYTATPYANVFIDANAEHEDAGDDLFPRDFIVGLQAPSNYVGAERVFGAGPENPGLPMVNRLTDHETWIPPDHSSDFVPSPDIVPASLGRALDSFILSCAARRLRGDANAPNSMLIHVTRFKKPQAAIGDQVTDMLAERFNELRYASDADPVWRRLEEIWSTDYLPMAHAIRTDSATDRVDDFAAVRPHLAAAVGRIEVRLINGDSDDVLDYDKHPEGLSTIVVGGAKLSRGLTLEGLTVSYYARTTRLYDALMQMGRWFGYRPGYLDLCRVYAPSDVVSRFRNVSIAAAELLREIKILEGTGMTPREFGLRVRHSPGMLITGNPKMRNTQIRRVGFGAQRPESTSLDLSHDRRRRALDHLSTLVDGLTASPAPYEPTSSGDHAWRMATADLIIDYFDALASDDLYRYTTGRPLYLADYIRKRNDRDDLTEWTVLLKSNSQWAGEPVRVGNAGISVGPSRRSDGGRPDRYSFNSLIGSDDERFDLTEHELERAAQAAGSSRSPTGVHYRHARSSDRGLLILYILDPAIREDESDGPPFVAFCVSFPSDPDGTKVEYRINSVQIEQEMGG